MNKIDNLSICFPVYNDEGTIETLVNKSIQLRDYLKCPILWKFFGKQFFIIIEKPLIK